MKRHALDTLSHWFAKKNRKPLVLRGARQVGKSTLVRLFAKKQGLVLAEINLEVHRKIDETFASLDLQLITLELESILDVELGPNVLLFLDEIQATPYALQALRYFYELHPEWPVIAAGSLLEFTLADHNFSMPVGRIQYLHLGPMTLDEFIEAAAPNLHSKLQKWEPKENLPQATHKKLSQYQREYLLTGGMPEVIDSYLSENSFQEAQEIQQNICKTYLDDFSKYAKQTDLADLQQLFRRLPSALGTKIKYTHLLPDRSSLHTKNLLELLERASIFHGITRSHANGTPLGAESNPKFRKPLFLDVGLVSSILGLKWSDLKDRSTSMIHEGNLAEQFIGQHLLQQSHDQALFYWAREGRKNNAELDYIIACGQHLIPIEVKSGKAGSLKSLHQFMFDKGYSMAIRFDQNPISHQYIETEVSTGTATAKVDYNLISMPFYAIGHLPQWIEKWRFEMDSKRK
jgi:predicted AAA+ superfamily ATPase